MKVPTDSERLDFLIRRQGKARTYQGNPAIIVGGNTYVGETYREAIDLAIRDHIDHENKAA